jgi:predicted nucleic acid-binding protein
MAEIAERGLDAASLVDFGTASVILTAVKGIRVPFVKVMSMRLYLDNCCFNRPFDDQSTLTIRLETEAKLHIQHAIRAGQYALGWSYILDYENAANPLEERRVEIQQWKALADSVVTETPAILATMTDLVTLGFKPLDALHLACAQALGCQYFLTVDKGILKKATLVSALRIVSPVEFVIEQGV